MHKELNRHGIIADDDAIPTNQQIIDDLTKAFAKADALGANWVDCLPDYIDCDQNLADESDYIGTLGDGRNLYYTPHEIDIFLIEDGAIRTKLLYEKNKGDRLKK